MVIFIQYVRPFKTDLKNNLEIFNELTIIACGYMLVVFADFVPDPDVKRHSGFAMLGIVGFNLLVNFYFLMTL